ncbi:MAG: aspartate aminotransferase family protein [Ignavibacteria bacterium]
MTLLERETRAFLSTYKRLPVEIVRGNGMYLYDKDDNAYLDFLGGVAVNALGYGHTALQRAITEQAARYIHISNSFAQEPQIVLAEMLKEITQYERVFFCNSGTEATEAAIKLARKWGAATWRSTLVSMENSFHGRTLGALSLMTNADYREGFGPFLEGCSAIPFNDVAALENVVGTKTAAVFFECIQGEGGIVEMRNEFAQRLNALRDRFGFLLIADEVQSGIGRTGKFLACEHYDVKPDIVTLAKPLGGGLPLGAVLVNQRVSDVLKPGNHGTTFGGNPVACAAGRVVLHEIVHNGIMHNAALMGDFLVEKLRALQRTVPHLIKDVRGKGLMVGMELSAPGKPVMDALLEHRILLNCTHTTVLRFLPPLIVEKSHIEQLCGHLAEVLPKAMSGTNLV